MGRLDGKVAIVTSSEAAIGARLPGRKATDGPPALTLPVRHSLDGFDHAPKDRSGQGGDGEPVR